MPENIYKKILSIFMIESNIIFFTSFQMIQGIVNAPTFRAIGISEYESFLNLIFLCICDQIFYFYTDKITCKPR